MKCSFLNLYYELWIRGVEAAEGKKRSKKEGKRSQTKEAKRLHNDPI